MLEKRIVFCGLPARVICDGRCNKAWGISSRPAIRLSDDEDDWLWVPDSIPLDAPIDPGTSEGDERKPTRPEDRLNKWCVRECERSVLSGPGGEDEPLELPDFSGWVRNIPEEEATDE